MALLEGDLAQAIYDGFKGRLLRGVIRQFQSSESGSLDEYGDPIDLAPVDTAIEGFVEDYDAMYLARAGLPENSIKVNIFAKSAPSITPTRDDLVRFDRAGVSTWYQLRRVQTDPALAMWTCPDAFEIEDPTA
jgi:hypothetical protein